ncbi:hypothetical protein FOA43_000288 [Brettanomyces nanus]|uniref:Transcription initiation factor TFIID subunit 2 n=1 Tax=Eeniella nana TaxID=13502 RepID=A0A875S0K3_EENNA|nr:uncharacterized protein FOA43_000288 [Brettanomyces nanus]QPG72984.1 hypothetical protein FOA43_000288 [Brettanomyces nanus]
MSIALEYPLVSSRVTPRTPRHHHHHEADNFPAQRFKVGYQKVILDIDLAEQTIYGETEITALPLEASLKEVKLDCHGIQIKSVIVNQRCARFSYLDFGQNDEYMNDTDNSVLADYKYDSYVDTNSTTSSVEQHHFYRGKHYPLYSDQNNASHPSSSYPQSSSELVIKIPESIKLRLQTTTNTTSTNSRQNFSSPVGSARSINGTPATANGLVNSDKVYTPLNIKIIYTVRNSRNGIIFHGGRHTDIPKNRWFCYTFNNALNCSASSWVPCVDNFHEKPAWDINIVVPKTVGDIGETKIVGTKEAEKAFRKIQLEEMDEDDAEDAVKKVAEEDEEDDGQEFIDESTPIVVAVPDLVSSKETPQQFDLGKKVVNFQFYNPICAHHLGFAVGPFEKTPLLDLKPGTDRILPSTTLLNSLDDASDEAIELSVEANSNKVPTMFYYLPGMKRDVINTTIFLYKALDFYSKEFSSFPFTSYTLVFIEDFPCDACSFAGITIASDSLLYGPELVEPIFKTTEILAVSLAEQYAGVNVLPRTLNDIWCTVGLSKYMALQFLKKLFGLNQYKYMIKKQSDLLCKLDVGMRPLANQCFRFPLLFDQDLEFIRLKAPLILYILNQRMTKTDRSFGLSRVIPKIFLQAMSNDLPGGNCLSTSHFQHVCEKVAHHKLDEFFYNWVHNTGVPIFSITQKFNKKRMFIEMSIRQIQRSSTPRDNDDVLSTELREDKISDFRRRHFVDEAGRYVTKEPDFEPQNAFTGPVTIRIHEADGTPYEHIMYIRDGYTKLDIQYNTKYRRAKRKKEGVWEEDEEKEGRKSKDEEKKDSSLGDVLMTATEAENWRLKEDDSSDDNSFSDPQAYAFEWMRFDADGEWICQKRINVTDQMEESKLRQDRDVEAQLEGVIHFGDSLRPKLHYANVLLRTLIDKRYYFGVRTEAVRGLSKISKEENDHIGMRYLLRAFKNLYCYNGETNAYYDEFDPKEYLPVPNDFSNFTDLFVMKAIVKGLSQIRNKDGDIPIELKRILLNIFKYNDNMDNEFDDCFYVCDLLGSLSNLIIHSNKVIANHNISALDASDTDVGGDDRFSQETLMEMNRAVKMDEWSPSYHDCVERKVFQEKIRMVRCGLINMPFQELVSYTGAKHNPDIRILAFEGLLLLGGLKNGHVLELFFTTLKIDPSVYVRYHLMRIFEKAIGVAAFDDTPSILDDEEFAEAKLKEQIQKEQEKKKMSINGNGPSSANSNGLAGNGMVIVEESSSGDLMQFRRDQIARKTISGAIALLRRDYAVGNGLQKHIWEAMHSCMLSIGAKRELLDIAIILYRARNTFVVRLDLPTDKKIIAVIEEKSVDQSDPNTGKFVIGMKREGRLMIQIPTIKLKNTYTTSSTLAAAPVQSSIGTTSRPLLRLHSAGKERSSARTLTPKVGSKSVGLAVKVAVKSEPLGAVEIPPTAQPQVKDVHVQVDAADGKFTIRLKFKKGISLPGAPKKAKCHVTKTSSILPIRYVKIRLNEKEIWLSDADNFGIKAPSKQEVLVPKGKPTKLVSLKIVPEKLAKFTSDSLDK